MGFDWEDILGDTSYEDAVYNASKFFEKNHDAETLCCEDFLKYTEEDAEE